MSADARERTRVWLAPAASLLVALAFFLFADPFLLPPDPVCYWSWGESLLTDMDFGFQDEFSAFEVPVRYVYLSGTGRLANDWPMGSGLALMPWLLLGRAAAHAWVLVLLGGACALWLSAVRRQFTTAGRSFAVAAMIAGSPLLFYALFAPFYSHPVSFATTTAFLALWATTRSDRSPREWILLGVLLGLAALVRPQNVLLGVAFLAELPRARGDWRPWLAGLARAAGASVLAFAPQLAVYASMNGHPLALPKAEELRWLSPAIGKVLFSDFHGVLPWTPVYALGLAGLVVLGRRDGRLAAGLGLVFAAQLHINAANQVWWSGGSFGNRRLADCAIVLAWGLAALWDGAPGRAGRLGVAVATALCCAWTLTLLLAERRLLVPLNHYVPFDRELPATLARVFTEPAATVEALTRGLDATSTTARFVAAAGLAGGCWPALVFAPRLRRASIGRAAPVVLALAALLSAACIVAAWRTPRITSEQLLERLPTAPGVLWDNHMELAFYHSVRREGPECEAAARAALAMEPDHHAAWSMLGTALLLQERWVSAGDAFRRALEINPSHERSRQGLALAHRGEAAASTAP